MTKVLLAFKAAQVDGTDVAQAGGYWEFRPYAPVVLPDYVLTTEKFTVHLGADPVLVDFRPTDAQWCWVGIPRQIPGAVPRYFSVPDTTETINFFVPPGAADPKITDVDPKTLAPSAEPEAAWWAFANGLKVDWDAAVTAVTSSATSAAGSATAAATSEANASTSAAAAGLSEINAAEVAANASAAEVDASAAATAAGASATAAGTSATSALASKNAAAQSETNAAGSATSASGSAGTATTQAGLANTARAAAEAARDQAVAATILTGTGSPEGVQVANVGRKYVDTAKTNGAREWIKDSGTGNTGWVVAIADTGPRDMASLLLPGLLPQSATTRYIRLRRVGVRVTLNAALVIDPAGPLVGASRTTINILNIPSGFGTANPYGSLGTAGVSVSGAQFLLTNGANAGRIDANFTGLGGTWSGSEIILLNGAWDSQIPWPAALPGTPIP